MSMVKEAFRILRGWNVLQSWEYQKSRFRIKHTEYKMPVDYSSGDIKWLLRYLGVELIRVSGLTLAFPGDTVSNPKFTLFIC